MFASLSFNLHLKIVVSPRLTNFCLTNACDVFHLTHYFALGMGISDDVEGAYCKTFYITSHEYHLVLRQDESHSRLPN